MTPTVETHIAATEAGKAGGDLLISSVRVLSALVHVGAVPYNPMLLD